LDPRGELPSPLSLSLPLPPLLSPARGPWRPYARPHPSPRARVTTRGSLARRRGPSPAPLHGTRSHPSSPAWRATCGPVPPRRPRQRSPRLSGTVNLVVVLNTKLDHAFDELSRARVEIAQLRAERAEHRHLEDGSPAPVGTQHPYRSPERGNHAYGNPDYRTKINLEP
jgi:hypothetical protein